MDPILVEIIRNALLTITREMKSTVIRTAHSSTVQEAHDFSVALFEGPRLLAQAEAIAVHVGALPHCVDAMFGRFGADGLQNGDIVIVNDPFAGGSHLPDVTMIKAVRIGDLLFLPIVRAHWSDVGGMSPGSITGKATSIYQEGLRIPPIKLYAGGRLVDSTYDLILQNVRLPHQRAGDIRAQVAACNLAEDRLQKLVERYGAATVAEAIRQILDVTERRTRAAIENIPPGEYTYEDYLDSDGIRPQPVELRVKIRVADGNLTVDFAGTSPQCLGPVNATLGVTFSGVLIALKSLLDPQWPCNEGFFRPLRLVNVESTCTSAEPPAPTGSCWEVGSRVVDVVIAALARVLPDQVAGAGCGSINHTFIGGRSTATDEAFVWYEYPNGGRGATNTANGCSAVARITGGDTRDLSIERAELEFPLLCTRYELRTDSGGPGRFRGGLGLIKEMQVLSADAAEPPLFSCLWDRVIFPPYGINMGLPGAPQKIRIRRHTGEYWDVPAALGAKETMVPMAAGDTLVMMTAGGGGHGDPLTAVPAAVAADVRAGYVSAAMARAIYGVRLLPSGDPDEAATAASRQHLQAARGLLQVAPAAGASGLGRQIGVHPDTAGRLGLAAGELVEIAPEHGPPLRGWLAVSLVLSREVVQIDSEALQLLGVAAGDRVWLRSVDLDKLVQQGAAVCSASA